MNPLFLQSKINRTIIYEGKEYLFFSGTAYLGMGAVDEFEELVLQGIKKYGLNHGLSRINNVRLAVYDEFESFFAAQTEAEKSLLFSSGYIAGHAAVSFLKNKADRILVAPDTHPAVLPDELVPDPSLSFGVWVQKCLQVCSELPVQRILFLANALDPLKPAIHDFDWMQELPQKHEYTLLLDDSHAFGVFGKGIFGTYSQWKKLPVELIISGSLGKGLGLPAGIVLGNSKIMGELADYKIFGSSSPPPPGYLDAFLAAQHLYESRRKKLQYNMRVFSESIGKLKYIVGDSGYPVFVFKDYSLVKELEKKEIIVSSFSYPTVKDKAINRIVLSAHHEESDLMRLATELKQWKWENKSD